MKRPLLIVAISYVIGIIIGVYFKISIPFIVLMAIGLIINKLILSRKNAGDLKTTNSKNLSKEKKNYIENRNQFEKKKSFKESKNAKFINIVILGLFTILISSSKTTYLNNKYENLYLSIEQQDRTFIGTICSNIEETDYKYTFTIKVDSVDKSTSYENTQLILNLKKNKNSKNTKLEYGNKILVTGTYEEPTGPRNYKGFSYKEYLKSKKTYGIVQVENEENIKLIKKQNTNFISTQVNKLSEKLKSNIKQILPEECSGLAQGVLLGDCSDIEQELQNNFKNCNLSHMLAVSGSHLSYLMIGLKLILNKKIVGNRKSKIVTILIIILFMMITNMSPSVVRAGVSVIISIIGNLIYRKQDTYTTIGLALLLTLIQNPFNIFNIGMQLSYAGTIGILLFQAIIKNNLVRLKIYKNNTNINNEIQDEEKVDNLTQNKEASEQTKLVLKKIKNYLIESISVTLSANILIFPLTLYHFNTISLNFIISNLIVGPMLGLAIILGLLVLLVSIIAIPIAKIIAIPLNILLLVTIKITEIIAKIPMGNLTVITPRINYIILIYIFLIKLLISIKKEEISHISKIKYIEKIKTKTLAIIISIIIISTNLFGNINIEKSLKLYFIDVGQGDSSLICTPSGKKILIDGGGTRNPEKYDVGKQILLPYLLDRRISYLDYIMVSHFDADHAQGLEAVLENIKVKNVIISKQASICVEYEKIMEICNQKKINVIVVKRGRKIQIDKYVYFDILHPGDKMLDDGKGGLNANAIVAKLYFKLSNNKTSTTQNIDIRETDKSYFTILFTGDIETDAEAELVKIYGDKLKSDILKVGHHRIKDF